MKKLIVLSSLLALFACKKETPKAFTSSAPVCNTSEQLGKEVILALSENSIEHYINLTPSLTDLHLMMDTQVGIYGSNIEDAKTQFAIDYENKVVPELTNSFLEIRKKGSEKNITWSEISYKSVELLTEPIEKLSVNAVPMAISFTYHGNTYKLIIEKTIHFDNKWTISGLMELNNVPA
jgi:hypothetical protein